MYNMSEKTVNEKVIAEDSEQTIAKCCNKT